jgi:hypothetical protein
MKKHPEYGWAVLRMLPGFERAALDDCVAGMKGILDRQYPSRPATSSK